MPDHRKGGYEAAWCPVVDGALAKFLDGKAFPSYPLEHHERGDHKWGVYFLLAPKAGKLKVGITRNLKQRVKQLECESAEPLEFLGYTPAGYNVEQAIHGELHASRAHGEWYFITPHTCHVLTQFGVFLDHKAFPSE